MITWRSYLSTNKQTDCSTYRLTRKNYLPQSKERSKIHNDKAKNYDEKTKEIKKTRSERNDWYIRSTHPITKDTTMNKTIIHPPHGSLLVFVTGTSRDINQWWHQVPGGVSMPCLAQHPVPMTISSTEGRYCIIVHIIGDGLLLNFDASSGYLPTNLWKVLISFLAEKPWLKSLSASM